MSVVKSFAHACAWVKKNTTARKVRAETNNTVMLKYAGVSSFRRDTTSAPTAINHSRCQLSITIMFSQKGPQSAVKRRFREYPSN